MWHKLLWIVTALYPVSIVFIMIANAEPDATIWSSMPSFLVLLIPLGVLIYELRNGHPRKIWGQIILALVYLVSFVLLGVGLAGYYAFNTPTVFNIIKGLPLLVTLVALCYFALKRIFKARLKSQVG